MSRDEPLDTDIGTVVEIRKDGTQRIYSAVNGQNRAGYIPIVSIVVGGRRILGNFISAIKNIALTIFLQQSPVTASKKLSNNVLQMGRGMLEVIPIIGNITIYNIDKIRTMLIERQILNQEAQVKPETRQYYANGKLVSSGTIGQYEEDFTFMCYGGARFS